MGEASERVRKAAEDARSDDDLTSDPIGSPAMWPGEPPLDSPLDRETLDESASSQMGGYESRRRDGS